MPHEHSVTYIIRGECELKKHRNPFIWYISLKLNNPGAGTLLYKQWRGDTNMKTVCTFILQCYVSRRHSFNNFRLLFYMYNDTELMQCARYDQLHYIKNRVSCFASRLFITGNERLKNKATITHFISKACYILSHSSGRWRSTGNDGDFSLDECHINTRHFNSKLSALVYLYLMWTVENHNVAKVT